ncbi:hypothetical protein [Corynebacterium pygosceleis]|uniref:hypothetical protein n=1 Tax=Corynebacterium pygosceleis TaxID=2800406 RepID=UPI001905E0E8|nr:hypothetical protein [Corynebacterium pygosceleis]MCL0120656.1 hypothetical protein [Corynebacterium pygosceleis]
MACSIVDRSVMVFFLILRSTRIHRGFDIMGAAHPDRFRVMGIIRIGGPWQGIGIEVDDKLAINVAKAVFDFIKDVGMVTVIDVQPSTGRYVEVEAAKKRVLSPGDLGEASPDGELICRLGCARSDNPEAVIDPVLVQEILELLHETNGRLAFDRDGSLIRDPLRVKEMGDAATRVREDGSITD